MGNLRTPDSPSEQQSGSDQLEESQNRSPDEGRIRSLAVDNQQGARDNYVSEMEYQKKYQPATALSLGFRPVRDGENVTGFQIMFDKGDAASTGQRLLDSSARVAGGQKDSNFGELLATERENVSKPDPVAADSKGEARTDHSFSFAKGVADKADLQTEVAPGVSRNAEDFNKYMDSFYKQQDQKSDSHVRLDSQHNEDSAELIQGKLPGEKEFRPAPSARSPLLQGLDQDSSKRAQRPAPANVEGQSESKSLSVEVSQSAREGESSVRHDSISRAERLRLIHEELKNSPDGLVLGGKTKNDEFFSKPEEIIGRASRGYDSSFASLNDLPHDLNSLHLRDGADDHPMVHTLRDEDDTRSVQHQHESFALSQKGGFDRNFDSTVGESSETGIRKREGNDGIPGIESTSSRDLAGSRGDLQHLLTRHPELQEIILDPASPERQGQQDLSRELELIARNPKLTDSQLKTINESLEQILDARKNDLQLLPEEKVQIAVGLINQLSAPGETRQGWITANESTRTCGQAVVENVVNSRAPEIYAKSVALAATRGTLEIDGKEQKVFTNNELISGNHAENRPLVSQVFQNAVASWTARQQGERFVVEEGREFSTTKLGEHKVWGTSASDVQSALHGLTGHHFASEVDKLQTPEQLKQALLKAGDTHGYPLAVLTQDNHHWVDILRVEGNDIVVNDPLHKIPEKVSVGDLYKMLDDKASPDLKLSVVYEGTQKTSMHHDDDRTVRGGGNYYSYGQQTDMSHGSTGMLTGGTNIDVHNYQQRPASYAPYPSYPAYPKFNGAVNQTHGTYYHPSMNARADRLHPHLLQGAADHSDPLRGSNEHFRLRDRLVQNHPDRQSPVLEQPMTAHYSFQQGRNSFSMDLKLPPGSTRNGPIHTTVGGVLKMNNQTMISKTELIGNVVTDQYGTRYEGKIITRVGNKPAFHRDYERIRFH